MKRYFILLIFLILTLIILIYFLELDLIEITVSLLKLIEKAGLTYF